MDTIVSEQSSTILMSCGLGQKIGLMQSCPSDVTCLRLLILTIIQQQISKQPGMDAKSISETMKSFENLLSDPSAMLTPQCDRLINSQLRAFARSSVSQLVYESYLLFYNTVMDPKSGYENPDSLFVYKPEQVKTMVDAL
jgi:hypothetical protein